MLHKKNTNEEKKRIEWVTTMIIQQRGSHKMDRDRSWKNTKLVSNLNVSFVDFYYIPYTHTRSHSDIPTWIKMKMFNLIARKLWTTEWKPNKTMGNIIVSSKRDFVFLFWIHRWWRNANAAWEKEMEGDTTNKRYENGLHAPLPVL